jgi:hypothetical protein
MTEGTVGRNDRERTAFCHVERSRDISQPLSAAEDCHGPAGLAKTLLREISPLLSVSRRTGTCPRQSGRNDGGSGRFSVMSSALSEGQAPSDGSRVLPVRHVERSRDISQPRSAAEDCHGSRSSVIAHNGLGSMPPRHEPHTRVIARLRSSRGNLPGPGLGGDQGEDRHDTGVSRDDRRRGGVESFLSVIAHALPPGRCHRMAQESCLSVMSTPMETSLSFCLWQSQTGDRVAERRPSSQVVLPVSRPPGADRGLDKREGWL